MSRAAALEKMREARRLMAEAERELQEQGAEPAPAEPPKVDDEDLARARRRLRKVGVAV